jgi:predicted PurR-regulated permease PerM
VDLCKRRGNGMASTIDPNKVTDTIGNFIQGFSKIFAGGTTSLIILGVVSLVLMVAFWYFKSQIVKLLRKLAAYMTELARNKQSQASKEENAQQEKQIQTAQQQLQSFEDSEQKSMLDAQSYSDLIKYATLAYGAEAVTAVLQKAASQDDARIGLYKLYGLKQKGE